MIIIGEKLNGSIPSVAKAIAEKDADLIRERARMQAEAGATFLDVCASVEEDVEVETLKWMIDLVQEVTDTPICVDSPSAKSCVAAIPFCKRPGLINSVSLEGDKIDTIFPVIADTDWECVALLCDNDGIPDSVERRMKIFFGIMEKAKQFGKPVQVGIIIPKSAGMAKFMNNNVAGIHVPDEMLEELKADKEKTKAGITGVEIAARIIKECKPYCQGVHIMALGWESKIPDLLKAAEI